jgi:pimeloyl-ACP methyl ester carboxylesterase
LGVSRAAFVGMSLGGWLALDYADRRPSRVDRLALIAPAGIGRQKYFALKRLLLRFGGQSAVRMLRHLLYPRRTRNLAANIQALVELKNLTDRTFLSRADKIPIFDDAALCRLSMPVLVITGGRDMTMSSAETRRRLARAAPRIIVRYLPAANHYIEGQSGFIVDFLLEGAPTPNDAMVSVSASDPR